MIVETKLTLGSNWVGDKMRKRRVVFTYNWKKRTALQLEATSSIEQEEEYDRIYKRKGIDLVTKL